MTSLLSSAYWAVSPLSFDKKKKKESGEDRRSSDERNPPAMIAGTDVRVDTIKDQLGLGVFMRRIAATRIRT